MQILRKLLDVSELFLSAVCVAAFVGMFVLGIATVVFRFLLDSSLAFPEELIRYLFVWMIFLGSAIAFRRNMHAAIGALVMYLPDTLRRPSLLFATSASIVFFAVILNSGIQLTRRVGPQISPALEVSMAWAYAAVPAGMVFLIIYAAELLVLQIRKPVSDLIADGQ